jgi:hypothetical protein
LTLVFLGDVRVDVVPSLMTALSQDDTALAHANLTPS